LTLASDRVDVPQGQAGLIAVQTLIRSDYGGPIELSVVGPPGLSGVLAVAPGAQSGPPPAPGQRGGAPFAMLPVRAAADLAPGAYEVLVRAKATVDGREVVAFASTAAAVSQGLAGLPYPPRTWLRGVGVAVLPRPPVTLSARWEPPEAVRGLATTLVVTAEREKDFDGDVALSLVGLPPNVTAAA